MDYSTLFRVKRNKRLKNRGFSCKINFVKEKLLKYINIYQTVMNI